MSLSDVTDKMRRTAEQVRKDLRATIDNLTNSLPRPLMERKTLILKEPIMKILRERLIERK